jgi:hypothetical protein
MLMTPQIDNMHHGYLVSNPVHLHLCATWPKLQSPKKHPSPENKYPTAKSAEIQAGYNSIPVRS